jgi:two-component system sensor histidine kinase RegB
VTAQVLSRPDAQGVVGRKNLLILIQLRWIAVVGQIVTMTVVHLALGVDLPLAPMAAVLGALVALNIASLLRLSKPTPVSNAELFAALVFDVAALTTQLYLSGGATNPFTFLFLLQVTIGAVLLSAWSTWALVGLTGLCFAGLTIVYRPLDLVSHNAAELFTLHIYGTLSCFALDAALLVVFVTRINQNLRERDTRLADLRQQAAEEDHIVRMGLLASGAAHELGTPLSTLSVILGDWRRMPALTADPELAQEIAQMQAEVQRCKTIVTGILLSAGEARGESAGVTTLHTFLGAGHVVRPTSAITTRLERTCRSFRNRPSGRSSSTCWTTPSRRRPGGLASRSCGTETRSFFRSAMWVRASPPTC